MPLDHPDRNSHLAVDALLDKVAIPASQIYTIPAELGPEQGAALYRPIVAEALPFDVVMLGLGEDGHTASLFPGHVHPADELAHPVYNSPKPPPERVSVSAKALSTASQVIFLVTGKNKQAMVKAWRAGEALPMTTIAMAKPVDVYMDADANAA